MRSLESSVMSEDIRKAFGDRLRVNKRVRFATALTIMEAISADVEQDTHE